MNNNGSNIWISVAFREIINIPSHYSWRLVSNHFTIDHGTDWALEPFLFPNEHFQAFKMQQMTALQGHNILIMNIEQKFLELVNFLWVLELKLANTTLMLSKPFVWKQEFKDREERIPCFQKNSLWFFSLLFYKHLKQCLNFVVKLVTFVYLVVVMHFNLVFFVRHEFATIMGQLLYDWWSAIFFHHFEGLRFIILLFLGFLLFLTWFIFLLFYCIYWNWRWFFYANLVLSL